MMGPVDRRPLNVRRKLEIPKVGMGLVLAGSTSLIERVVNPPDVAMEVKEPLRWRKEPEPPMDIIRPIPQWLPEPLLSIICAKKSRRQHRPPGFPVTASRSCCAGPIIVLSPELFSPTFPSRLPYKLAISCTNISHCGYLKIQTAPIQPFESILVYLRVHEDFH